jgi:hypothetical protein
MLERESPWLLREGACEPRNLLRVRRPWAAATATATGASTSDETPEPAGE